MSVKSASIIREREYEILSSLSLEGTVLDVGGSKKSGYHELIKGNHTYHVINLDPLCEPDTFVDIETPFPFSDESFNHSICLNVLEHVFEFEHVFREQVRCVKKGGTMIFATPMVYHIHGSPDDYMRYTASSYERLAKKYDCTIVSLEPIGYGLFSLLFQTLEASTPRGFIRESLKKLAIATDKLLVRFFKKYATLKDRIPLGYFVLLKRN